MLKKTKYSRRVSDRQTTAFFSQRIKNIRIHRFVRIFAFSEKDVFPEAVQRHNIYFPPVIPPAPHPVETAENPLFLGETPKPLPTDILVYIRSVPTDELALNSLRRLFDTSGFDSVSVHMKQGKETRLKAYFQVLMEANQRVLREKNQNDGSGNQRGHRKGRMGSGMGRKTSD
jgi:hypothetical protein